MCVFCAGKYFYGGSTGEMVVVVEGRAGIGNFGDNVDWFEDNQRWTMIRSEDELGKEVKLAGVVRGEEMWWASSLWGKEEGHSWRLGFSQRWKTLHTHEVEG